METVATEPQVRFITTLLDTRIVPEGTRLLVKGALDAGALPRREASKFIDALKLLPVKPKPQTVPAGFAEADAMLADTDTSFYAIPAAYVSAQREALNLNGNDHLFIRTRRWNGRVGLYRVQGSVGGFSYWRIRNPQMVLMLARLVRDNGLEFQKAFHTLTGKCGRCGADLTDLKSRETGFGPECRKIIGIRA